MHLHNGAESGDFSLCWRKRRPTSGSFTDGASRWPESCREFLISFESSFRWSFRISATFFWQPIELLWRIFDGWRRSSVSISHASKMIQISFLKSFRHGFEWLCVSRTGIFWMQRFLGGFVSHIVTDITWSRLSRYTCEHGWHSSELCWYYAW